MEIDNQLLGIIFGVIAMVGIGLANALLKVPAQNIGIVKTTFFRNLFMSIILLVVLVVSFFVPVFKTEFSLVYILIAFLVSLVGYLPLLTYVKATKIGKIGVVSPVSGSSVIFTIMFSMIIFNEPMGLSKAIPIALIFLGIVLNSMNFKGMRFRDFLFSSGIAYALISAFLWGLTYTIIKIPINVLGPILTAFIMEFGIMIYGAINLRVIKESFSLPSKRDVKYLLWIAICGSTASIAINLGIMVYEVGVVMAIAWSNPIIATLYSRFVFREKLVWRQWSALVLIVVGIALIFNL